MHHQLLRLDDPDRKVQTARSRCAAVAVLIGLGFSACGSDSQSTAIPTAAVTTHVAAEATVPVSAPQTTVASDGTTTAVARAEIGGGEVALVSSVRPVIEALIAALSSGDLAASRVAFTDYDSAWNGIEVYVNVRDKDLYEKLEQDLQGPIGDALEADSPDLTPLVALAEQLGESFDQAIANSTNGPSLSPLFDDVTAMRIVRRDLRRTTALLQAGDVAGATETFNSFKANYPLVQELVTARSATANGQITAAIDAAANEFDEGDEPADALAPLVATLSGRYNFALSLWNAAARNTDLAKTAFTPEDAAATIALRTFEASVAKSLELWKAGDFTAAAAALEASKSAFARAQPVLAAKNADATIAAAFDAYSPLVAAAGDSPTAEAGATALIEAGLVGEQVVVGQFWDDPALQQALTAGASRPEDVIAPLTEVKIKLAALISLGNQAAQLAATGDWDAANDSYESLINIWFEVEGAVNDTDRDVYERSETAQGLISDGIDNENAERVATGAADHAATIQQFLDTYTK